MKLALRASFVPCAESGPAQALTGSSASFAAPAPAASTCIKSPKEGARPAARAGPLQQPPSMPGPVTASSSEPAEACQLA